MKSVLVIGSGGREHALAWGLARSDKVRQVYCMPGNGGTARTSKVENVPFCSLEESVNFAVCHSVDLAVVGSETYLAQGIVDRFQSVGLRIFGPTQQTTQLESSKVFAVEFAHRHGIPVPKTYVFDEYTSALKYLTERDEKEFFIKADELCGGKGAVFSPNPVVGKQVLQLLLQERACGVGKKVLIQEALVGEEISVMVVTDGENYKHLPLVRDYKRRDDGDQGPNTGGMGAYAPVNIPQEVMEQIEKLIIKPTICGMGKEGLDGSGIVYFGIMVDPAGNPHLLEYNMRFGDPETQALLPLLKTDLYELLDAACANRLDQTTPEWYDKTAVCVIATSGGYPTDYGKESLPIRGIDGVESGEVAIFHAATDYSNGQWCTCGGRILGICSCQETLFQARKSVYAAIEHISFEGMHCRRDIADIMKPCAG